MITTATFMEIFSTLILITTLSLLAAMITQTVFSSWYKHYQQRKKKRLKEIRQQRQHKAEELKKARIHTMLINNHQEVKQENKRLTAENEALRRELDLYSELRAEMISNSIRLEERAFDLNCKLSKAHKRIETYKKVNNRIQAQAIVSQSKEEKADLFELSASHGQGEYFLELEVEPDGIIQAKGVTVEEIADLKDIMQGKSTTSDLDSAIVVAKMKDTVLFDKLQEQIKGAKQHLSLLIDRVDQKIQNKKYYKEGVEEYFYENTGFSIRDFLPDRSA
ncbi:hypothetical protein [Dysgonomonas sp. ZJ709]|uniref:hypothetical protein n=1 Tax=Dysgonomonas sp. ZJ709 TaxID=2709797 RepID=UPI0013ECDBFC|nr:hypothetical protein [Dysgonomonas sp. ZJ709]